MGQTNSSAFLPELQLIPRQTGRDTHSGSIPNSPQLSWCWGLQHTCCIPRRRKLRVSYTAILARNQLAIIQHTVWRKRPILVDQNNNTITICKNPHLRGISHRHSLSAKVTFGFTTLVYRRFVGVQCTLALWLWNTCSRKSTENVVHTKNLS